jgi:hypothetical protein
LQDSWEDEEEEKKDEEKKETTPVPAKPKKKIHDKIAEREVKMSDFFSHIFQIKFIVC